MTTINVFFAVNNTGDAEAFAITLEPAGGSLTLQWNNYIP
jgi:anti-sigma-K factor RskA